jgi:hypothetical protein
MAKPEYNRSPRTNTPAREAVDVQRVVDHLNHAFAMATKDMGRPARVQVEGSEALVPNKLYQLQVDFSYMINEIARGPRYIAPKIIADANELIGRCGK